MENSDQSDVNVAQFVLYINAWGVVSKIMQSEKQSGSDFFRESDINKCQEHFIRTLKKLESERSNDSVCEVYQAGDIAYVYAQNLKSLVLFARQLFQQMIFHQGKLVLWPLRAAIAREVNLNASPLKHGSPYIGRGNVEAAWLEKSAQKGMRLLVTKALREDMTSLDNIQANIQFRNSRARGIDHIEINWLDDGFLDQNVQSEFRLWSKKLMEVDDDYCRQLSASLTDLVSWSKKI